VMVCAHATLITAVPASTTAILLATTSIAPINAPSSDPTKRPVPHQSAGQEPRWETTPPSPPAVDAAHHCPV
jgi:hypothetical protein